MIRFFLSVIYGPALCRVSTRSWNFAKGFKHGAEAVINGLLESYSGKARRQCWLYRFGFSMGVRNARKRS